MRKFPAMTNVNVIVDAIKSAGNGSTGFEIANCAMANNPESFESTIKKQGSEEKARSFVYYVYDRIHNYPSSKNHVSMEVGDDGVCRFYLKENLDSSNDLSDDIEEEEDDVVEISTTTPDDYAELSKQTMNRKSLEKEFVSKLCKRDQIRYSDFWAVAKRINTLCGGNYFDVDHATSVSSCPEEAFLPDNLQLLNSIRNKIKNAKSEPRFTWEQQIEHIHATVQSATDKKHDEQELEYYIEQLKIIF